MAAPAPTNPPKRGSIDDQGVFDDAKTYYTTEERHQNTRAGPRTRTYSQVRKIPATDIKQHQLLTQRVQNSLAKQFERMGLKEPYRRGSHGKSTRADRFASTAS